MYVYSGVSRDTFMYTVRMLGFPDELYQALNDAINADPSASWRVHVPWGDIHWSPEGFLLLDADYDLKTWYDTVLYQEGQEIEIIDE